MYTKINFKTKKELKDAVASGKQVGVYQPNDMLGNPEESPTYCGSASVEGPHYPEQHRWYATVEINNGVITKVS